MKYETLTYLDVLKQGLEVMDSTASSLCMDNDIPLIVFSIMEKGNIKNAVLGETYWNSCKEELIMPKQVLNKSNEKMEKAIAAYYS